ncbi:MAG: ATP-grasp domain-containing protein [Deltaproteobacteria bacterium]|jgi:acetyl/propionyl-CoA carboxylase alpha subunit|nr:ATP-grasp domain-containing protein [Deltaproteobacteria bacterium]
MISKILIANRGEIVSRIIKTCKEMNISTVAVYSEADKQAPYLEDADETVLIGPANPVQSYLNFETIIDAARQTNAEALHPGYGFLSERGTFAEAVQQAGIIWMGPSPQVLKAISSKCYCRKLVDEVQVPVIPGTLDLVQNANDVIDYGNNHVWPVFIKLDKGGGGKGIERVNGENDADEVFQRAKSIGEMAFGSGDCYIEEIVENSRHIEIQFLADQHGNCVCLGERECSVQRRHQKIIEEAPSLVVTKNDRSMLFDRTVKIVQKMGYYGAGTIEFLRSEDGNYYFMEINARLQVEHPVTEYLTGVDIVKWQILIASKKTLDFTQQTVKFDGHAIEARVYAEDPETFIPSPGTITDLKFPEQDPKIRIDHALKANAVVPPYYDPMLAKVIAWDIDRKSASNRLIKALTEFQIKGVKTTIPVNLKILKSMEYQEGNIDTSFIDNSL